MDKNWTKVNHTDYYQAFHAAEGFKAGDRIDVKWRDGSITTETLRIKKGMDSAQIDMNNHPDYFPTQDLYVIHESHGEKIHLSLNHREIRKHG